MEIFMRTNVVIDDILMDQAKKITGYKTKKEIIEKSLQLLISVYNQKNILKYKGKLKWEGDIIKSRESRT